MAIAVAVVAEYEANLRVVDGRVAYTPVVPLNVNANILRVTNLSTFVLALLLGFKYNRVYDRCESFLVFLFWFVLV